MSFKRFTYYLKSKTTIAGLVTLIAGVGTVANHFPEVFTDTIHLTTAVTQIVTGLGLIFSEDAESPESTVQERHKSEAAKIIQSESRSDGTPSA